MKVHRAIQPATSKSNIVIIVVLLCLTALWSCSDDKGTASDPTETISAPNTPSGASDGETDESLSYLTGGATSNLGHAVEYRFDWGDGTYSNWSSSTNVLHSWSDAGTYSVQAQARCATHTSVISSWSSEKSVAISDASQQTVTDIDGNVYQAVKIGDQWWMTENLKVTRYRNGDPIPHVTESGAWSGLTSGAHCYYANNLDNVETYGRLYNWFAVDDSRGLAPAGWHVPTDDEWKQLEMYLGMSPAQADYAGINWRGTDEGGKLKDTGITYWDSPNTGATNETGFSALPAGYRYVIGSFDKLRRDAAFWAASESNSDSAWFRDLSYSLSQIYRDDYDKRHGFAVRCVRD